MTGFLASVTSVEEAQVALGIADIIDLKNPLLGALGALPVNVVEDVVRFVDGRKPVSATVGDLPMSPDIVRKAVGMMAETGVDIVKVGFFGRLGHAACARTLSGLARDCKIVAVLFADQQPDFSLLDRLAEGGFYGVMLDTADKGAGNLCRWMDDEVLHLFVSKGKSLNMATGLAGSLNWTDIPRLSEINPDYLGFRGALCRQGDRRSNLDGWMVKRVAEMLQGCNRLAPPIAA